MVIILTLMVARGHTLSATAVRAPFAFQRGEPSQAQPYQRIIYALRHDFTFFGGPRRPLGAASLIGQFSRLDRCM